MEQPDPQDNGGAPYKRPPKPEEQALSDEFAVLSAQYGDQFPHICQFLQKEVDRIAKGHKSLAEEHVLNVESGKPVRLTYRISVPVDKYPSFNFVGRLLGPKGITLKGLEKISGCKLAILGKGSMKDKEREEKCRQEGGKYSHLNEDLHVWVQSYGPPDMAFYKLYKASQEIGKYLHADYNDEIFTEQMMVLEQDGTLPQGYTAARARGGRGRGGMRGGMSSRGGMMGGGMSRGGGGGGGGSMRGGGSMMRGGMRNRASPMRGGGSRGSGRGMHRGGLGGSAGATDSLYEDVYEPAPQNFNAGYENGSSSGGGGGGGRSYFDEFPEPRSGGSGDGLGYPRQSQGSYGGGDMMRMGGGMEMGRMGMDHGGMGLMGLKRGMDEMDSPAKFSRRY